MSLTGRKSMFMGSSTCSYLPSQLPQQRLTRKVQYPAFAPQPNITLQLTPTASLLVPYASLRRR
jgi:hypothetical protein